MGPQHSWIYAVFLGDLRLRLFEQGNQSAPWFQSTPGSLQSFATDCVQDQINVVNVIFKGGFSIIDGMIHPQAVKQIDIL